MLIKGITDFAKITQLLSATTAKDVGAKKIVAIPYVMGLIITFELKDGSKHNFDVAYNEIWFETDNAYYKAIVNPDIYNLLKQKMKKRDAKKIPFIYFLSTTMYKNQNKKIAGQQPHHSQLNDRTALPGE